MHQPAENTLDIQGHRGCRGLMPENTIPAFLHAVDLGVTTLELDVVITGDQKVMVSHEPWISPEICEDANGMDFQAFSPEAFNIYGMTAADVQRYDCGTKPHPRFPEQQEVWAHKPLLETMIEEVEKFTAEHGLQDMGYNIEIKSLAKGDNVFHPEPKTFVELVLAVLEVKGIANRVTLQSFDARIMEEVHQRASDVTTAWLIEGNTDHRAALGQLSFTPDIYSCHYTLLDEKIVSDLHARGIQVKPWTVNETADMQRLIDYGVDGIITDYPDRLIELVSGKEKQKATLLEAF